MLATAGTTSATVAIVLVAGALFASSWGFLDLLGRPTLACRIAHVSKTRWLIVLGLSALTFSVSTICQLLLVPAIVFMGLDAVACVVGLVGGAWYLATVRPWVAAQIQFVRPRPDSR
jgi:hypothetical protein